jgi:uncharacterized protein (UPF0335 family)
MPKFRKDSLEDFAKGESLGLSELDRAAIRTTVRSLVPFVLAIERYEDEIAAIYKEAEAKGYRVTLLAEFIRLRKLKRKDAVPPS